MRGEQNIHRTSLLAIVQIVRFAHLECRTVNRQIRRFGVQTVKFDDLECRTVCHRSLFSLQAFDFAPAYFAPPTPIYTIPFGSTVLLTSYSIHLGEACLSCKFRSIELEHFVCDICTRRRIPALGDSTMGDLSTCASSGIRPFQARVNLGSVVQALRCNSQSTLLAVRDGSNWSFVLDRFLSSAQSFPGEREWIYPPDVMNQVVPIDVHNEERTSMVAFKHIWDGWNLVSLALCEAMRTNKTVRCLDLFLNFGSLEERHLTAIEHSLLENDTLQSFAILTGDAIACPHDIVRAAFSRILERNMCLVQIDIRCVMSVPIPNQRGTRRTSGPFWQVDLGATVKEALERNRQAWIVAEALGQVSRRSTHCYPHFGDVAFRRQLLLLFLQKGSQPPSMMLYIADGLPKH